MYVDSIHVHSVYIYTHVNNIYVYIINMFLHTQIYDVRVCPRMAPTPPNGN